MLRDMERCARSLARSVGYVGAATVEYLYALAEQKYYFLELNPRLQVGLPGLGCWLTNLSVCRGAWSRLQSVRLGRRWSCCVPVCLSVYLSVCLSVCLAAGVVLMNIWFCYVPQEAQRQC